MTAPEGCPGCAAATRMRRTARIRASLRASVDSSVRRLNPRTDWSTLSRSSAKSSVARSLSSPSTAKPVSFDLDSLSHRLRNFGFVEIMFGLIKYYYAHWDESEGGDVAGSSAAANDDGAATSASDADEEAEKEEEEARRALLRAAQLRATGAEGRETDEKDEGSSGDDVLDALSELVRSYFSVDFVEGEDGQREMVVMTSPEFLAFLLVAIILAGRFGHFLVQTYLITPVDPLLR